MTIINNIFDLAHKVYDVSVKDINRAMEEFTDYKTEITWTKKKVTIKTFVPETMEFETTSITFPFTDDDWYDEISSLQCWADYMYCENLKKEREE